MRPALPVRYLAFEGGQKDVRPRDENVVRLPVPDAEVPRVPLARPPGGIAGEAARSAGEIVNRTGDAVGDTVDALPLPPRR